MQKEVQKISSYNLSEESSVNVRKISFMTLMNHVNFSTKVD